MSSFNKVILMGNLTRDPQTKYLPSQTTVAEFGLAMNRRWKTQSGEDREEVTFVDCSAFGKTAELIGQHFTKGKPIHVEGRLKFDSWDDKNGGGKRSKLSVVVDSFSFVGSKSDGEGGGGGGSGDSTRQQQQPRQQQAPPQRQPAGEGPQEFTDDDIPF